MGGQRKAKKPKNKSNSDTEDRSHDDKAENSAATGKLMPKNASTKISKNNGKVDEMAGRPHRKTVEVTVHADQGKSVSSNSKRKTMIVNKENSGVNPNASPVEVRVRTRSSGNLTAAELNAVLPSGKNKTIKQKDLTRATEPTQIQNSGVIADNPSLNNNANIVDEDGIRMEVQTERNEDDSLNVNANRQVEYSPEVSESSSDSSSSSSDSTSSTSEDDKSYKRRKARSRSKKSRRKRRKRYYSSSGSEDEYSRILEKNPGLQEYLEKKSKRGKGAKRKKTAHKRKVHHSQKPEKTGKKNKIQPVQSITTIYEPALEKLDHTGHSPQVNVAKGRSRVNEATRQTNLNNSPTSTDSETERESSESEADEAADRDRRIHQSAEEIIINSEKYKAAATVLPEGGSGDKIKPKPYNYDDDANFMVSTCHVSATLVEKIEMGRFVQLIKLLNKSLRDQKDESDIKMELRHRDGQCYWEPVRDQETKITGIKRWEQAFRVYMTIYSEANPSRSGEILAYTDIISNAAQTYTWENIANYDFYFRRLMDKNPHRSWSRIHNQLWSLMMKDHIGVRLSKDGSGNNSKRDLRDTCCWRYNRGKCSKTAEDCKFEHRCSGCGSYNHIYYKCPKRGKRKEKYGDKPSSSRSKDDKKSKQTEDTNE